RLLDLDTSACQSHLRQVLWAFGFAGLGVLRRLTSSLAGRGPPATGGSPRRTPCLPCDPNGNRWQPVATVRPRSSHFRAAGGRNVCQQLRPLCSVPVPCQSAKNGPSKRQRSPRPTEELSREVATSDHRDEPLAVRVPCAR